MRISTSDRLARVVLMTLFSGALFLGPTGCGDSGPATGTSSELPPEAKQANKNMEDFMKNEPKK